MNRAVCGATMLLTGLTVSLTAQQMTFGAQIRPRTEFREPTAAGSDAFTSMRVRFHVNAMLENDVTAFIQFQDVRLWGSETNTLGDFSADNLDLHQAYVQFAGISNGTRLSARIGRQEINFGGQRLVGAVGWTQQGRAFDGVLLAAESDAVRINVLGAMLGDASAPATNDAFLLAAYGQLLRAGPGTLDLYLLFNRIEAAAETKQTTIGGRWWGQKGKISFRGETSLQMGQRGGTDVSAFMAGGRVGTSVGDNGTIALWYDYLSGDDDPTDGELKVFDTLFPTNHKFYGLADLFLDIPAHTGGRGLHDLAVKGALQASPKILVNLDLHSFRAAAGEGLATAHFGEEADLTVVFPHTANVSFTGGLSSIIAADGFAAIGRLTENMTWVYLMADVRF